MPIRPTHSLSDDRPRATREFTDREEFIAAFNHALATLADPEYRILVYYGVGGIGKSTLRRELCRQLGERKDPPVWAALDFDVPSFREEETALFAMRKALMEEHKIQFPSFDLAYAIYWQKTRPQLPFNKEHFPLFEDGNIIAEIIYLAGHLPMVGLIPKVAWVAAKGHGLVSEWWTRRGMKELRELPDMEPHQILARLSMFWAADLNDWLAKKQRTAVLFLDTFEALSGHERDETKLLSAQNWVRELIAHLPHVLWVICGREKLYWEKVDAEWGSALEQHLIGHLADSDIRHFLDQAGVCDLQTQDIIAEASMGVPYYLDLAVDIFYEIRDRHHRDPGPDDFSKAQPELQSRFIRYLNQAEVETLKVLAVARHWDLEVFKRLVVEFHTGYPVTAFADLCRFSFISKREDGSYCMHALMRESLQVRLEPDMATAIHLSLFGYYSPKLLGLKVSTLGSAERFALSEAFHHGKEALPVEEFGAWCRPVLEIFRDAADWNYLLQLTTTLLAIQEEKLGLEHLDVANTLDSLAVVCSKQGRHLEAELLNLRARTIFEKALGPDHPDVAMSLSSLAVIYFEQGKCAEAEPINLRALAIREKALGPDHPDVANSLNNLASALWGQGKASAAEPLHLRALAIYEKVSGPEHQDVAISLDNLGCVYLSQGKPVEAEQVCARALAIREKTLGPDHPYTATTMHNLACSYLKQGKYTQAEPLFLRVLAISELIYGPDHPDVAMSCFYLGHVYCLQGKFAEAEPVLLRALAIQEEALGPLHPYIGFTLSNLAIVMFEMQRQQEAEETCLRAMDILEKTVGPDHPQYAGPLVTLAKIRRIQQRDGEAIEYFRCAVSILEKTKGPAHKDTLDVKKKLEELLAGSPKED